jgi:hypothetical protein
MPKPLSPDLFVMPDGSVRALTDTEKAEVSRLRIDEGLTRQTGRFWKRGPDGRLFMPGT